VRIRVSIDSPHPLVCRKRRLQEWGGPSDKTGKTEAPCHSRCGTIKIPPCSKALRSKFCSPSPVIVASPYKWNILERDVKHYIINQSYWLLKYVTMYPLKAFFSRLSLLQRKGQVLFKGGIITKIGWGHLKSSQESQSQKSSDSHKSFLMYM
jgi:hypothetical protein